MHIYAAHNRQSNDKMQCSSLPEAEQGQQEEIFESTGDKEADSYQEQCQGKVKSKKNSVKARKVKRSSIILSVCSFKNTCTLYVRICIYECH